MRRSMAPLVRAVPRWVVHSIRPPLFIPGKPTYPIICGALPHNSSRLLLLLRHKQQPLTRLLLLRALPARTRGWGRGINLGAAKKKRAQLGLVCRGREASRHLSSSDVYVCVFHLLFFHVLKMCLLLFVYLYIRDLLPSAYSR